MVEQAPFVVPRRRFVLASAGGIIGRHNRVGCAFVAPGSGSGNDASERIVLSHT